MQFESKRSSAGGLIVLFVVTSFFVMLLMLNYARAASLTAHEIMLKNEDARKISDVQSSATLISGKQGAEKTKKFTWWRKLTSDGVHFNTLTRFHEPAEVRGEGILFLEHEGDSNDVQMYLPAYKKIRRVESQNQSGSFMGSELSYADIATPHVDDYKHTLQKESDACEADGKPSQCYVIESVPATDAVKERTGYSKTVQWVRKDNFIAVKSESFDAEGALWKVMKATDVREVDTTRHKWMSHDIRIENPKNGKSTTLRFASVKVNQGIPDSTFTQQNLQREK